VCSTHCRAEMTQLGHVELPVQQSAAVVVEATVAVVAEAVDAAVVARQKAVVVMLLVLWY